MYLIKHFTYLFCVCALATPAFADFVDDEFNGTTLGAHWTWSPGTNPVTEPTTSTYSVADGHLILTAAKGADQYANGDGGAYVEQDQPDDDQWIIETRISGFNPVDTGYAHRWNKAGLALHQDNNHWIYLFVTSGIDGTEIHWYGQAQFDPTGANGGARYIDEMQQFNIGYYEDYYLRLRKTADGYLGELSYDDITWIPITPLLRNPYSANGTLNGKIRLYTASGTPQADRNPAPARFDYIRKTSVLSTPVPFAEDEFDGVSTAEWNYVLGDPAGTIFQDGSALVMNPGATSLAGGSDIAPATNAATETGLVAWQRAPVTEDFSVYTQVTPANFADMSRYHGHGIRVWQHQDNWAGIKILKNGSTPGNEASRNLVEAMFVTDNGDTRSNTGVWQSTSATEPAPSYLRVDKAGSQFRVQYSFDAITWTPAVVGADPNGWVNFSFAAEQPLLVQLFSYLPNTNGTVSSIVDSRFEFLRLADTSSVEDWQLF